jgi:hypothetical protein
MAHLTIRRRRTFSQGFQYGLGLWLARMLVTLAAIPGAACLLLLALRAIDIFLVGLGL